MAVGTVGMCMTYVFEPIGLSDGLGVGSEVKGML